MSFATTAIVLDTRIKRNNDSYAVKLRVTYQRKQQYYPTGKHMLKEDWVSMNDPKSRKQELKQLKLYFSSVEQKAVKIINSLNNFSFPEFQRQFNSAPANNKDVLEFLKLKKEKLTRENRLTSAESYQSTIQSLKLFIPGASKHLEFADVTPDWLKDYEDWMIQKDKSITTVGIYLRNLRSIFNEAINQGIINSTYYPFGKYKYIIPSAKNNKKALSLNDIKRVFNYQTKTNNEEWAKDMWMLSYLCNGANVKDLALLRYRNLDNHSISFVRSKTKKSTKAHQVEIQVAIIPEIEVILNKWRTKGGKGQDFIFDILDLNDSPGQVLAKIKQSTKTINKYMKRIGEELELGMPLTTYTARHSFATILKRSGAPVEFISESLGHHNLKTTKAYLDSFENEARVEYQKRLLDF